MTFSSARRLRYSLAVIGWLLFVAFPSFAQYAQEPTGLDPVALHGQSEGQPATQSQPTKKIDQADTDSGKSKNDRMFFVMPNFLTVENESQVAPIPWKQKFAITAKGAVLIAYEFAIVGILSGIRQAENAYPAFGQGFEGYGKRYGTAFADQVDGNIMVGAVFPTILRTDPRYFQLGKGKFIYRFGYAISRILITRRDSGGRLFNIPEFAGNAAAIAISNTYYPAAGPRFFPKREQLGRPDGDRCLRERIEGVLARYSPLFVEQEKARHNRGERSGRLTGYLRLPSSANFQNCSSGIGSSGSKACHKEHLRRSLRGVPALCIGIEGTKRARRPISPLGL